MTFTTDQNAALAAKLNPDLVKDREQAGRKVSYIEGWHAIAEANRIFGFDGWHRETVYCHEVCRYERLIGRANAPGWKVGYEAKVRVTIGDAVREGTGHGSGIATDLFDAIESAAKEAETDAMKRALMTFGNPFGLALYDKSRINVGYEQPETDAPSLVRPRLVDPAPERAVNDKSATARDSIMKTLGKVLTSDDYDRLTKTDGYKEAYKALAIADRVTVNEALRRKRVQLGLEDDVVGMVGAG